MSKLVIGWFFGGRSTEHEVSVITALQAYENLDKNKYEVIPIYVSKLGEFYTSPKFLEIKNFQELEALLLSADKITLGRKDNQIGFFTQGLLSKFTPFDLAFPFFHGSFGEDGCIQGLFEIYQIPYTGFNVVGASLAMDKILQKQLYQSLGLPVGKYIYILREDWLRNHRKQLMKVNDEIFFPVFVKPASIGSSIGVAQAKNMDELEFAVEVAAVYCEKILVEEDFSRFREVNCSALGYVQSTSAIENRSVQASVCEMPLPSDKILSFDDKYRKGGFKSGSTSMASMSRVIPAPIKATLAQEIQAATIKIFKALDGCGVARVDFFIDEKRERFWVNEINAPPGSLAFYLWEKSDYFEPYNSRQNNPRPLPYQELLDLLIIFALERAENQKKTQYTFDSGLLS